MVYAFNRRSNFGGFSKGNADRCLSELKEAEYINGVPVTSIAPYAFEGNVEIRDLVCPPQVVEIGSRAFANCIALERIAFPARLARFENSWVAGCNNLEEIALPGSIIDLNLPSPAPPGEQLLACR